MIDSRKTDHIGGQQELDLGTEIRQPDPIDVDETARKIARAARDVVGEDVDNTSAAQEELGGLPTELSEDQIIAMIESGHGGETQLRVYRRIMTRRLYMELYNIGSGEKLTEEQQAVNQAGLDKVRGILKLEMFFGLVQECRREDGSVDSVLLKARMRAKIEKKRAN